MGLLSKFRQAAVEQDLLPNTVNCYAFWLRRTYAFLQKPASQWTGPDISRWLFAMHRLNYSAVSRKQALCADAATGISPMDCQPARPQQALSIVSPLEIA